MRVNLAPEPSSSSVSVYLKQNHKFTMYALATLLMQKFQLVDSFISGGRDDTDQTKLKPDYGWVL